MKKYILPAIPVILIGTMACYRSDVFTDLQISEEEVRNEIIYSLNSEDFYIPYNEVAKQLSPEARATAVKALAVFAKDYLSSEDFIYDFIGSKEIEEVDYEETEEELDMQFTTSEGYSVETQYETLKETIVYLKQMQDSPYLGETEKAELKKQIALAEQELAKAEKEHKANQLKTEAEGKEKNNAAYKQAKEDLEIEKNNSKIAKEKQETEKITAQEESRKLLKARLTDFLEYTADINFDAELVKGKNGKYYFADPELEAKDEQWKRFFRAGKEPVEAARAFAKEWLYELE